MSARDNLKSIEKTLPPRKNSRQAHPSVSIHEAYKRRFDKDEKIV
jgi:hypothetical protein